MKIKINKLENGRQRNRIGSRFSKRKPDFRFSINIPSQKPIFNL